MTPAPIQLDQTHQVNTYFDTTPEQAQINALFAYRAEAAKRNAAKVIDYNTQFDRYAADMNDRPASTNLIVPVPAVVEVVAISPEGWPSIVPGTEHVCPTRVWAAPVVTNPNTHGAITGGLTLGTATDPFLSAARFGAPVAYAGMKFLRVD